MSNATIRQVGNRSKRVYDRSMQNRYIEPSCLRLGRALFGVYNVHSGGLAHDEKPVPSWSAIAARESGQDATSIAVHLLVREDGVLGHWRHVATEVATSADHAEALARAIEHRYEDNEIFQRLTS